MAKYGPEQFRLKDGRTVVIRHCVPEDADRYPEFQRRCAQETTHTLQVEGRLPPRERTVEYYRNAEGDAVEIRLGVFDGDKLIGQLGVHRLPEHPWTSHIVWFGMMILRDYWGQGIAQQLMSLMDEHCRRAGVKRIEAQVRVLNERGVRLYKSCGFQIEGTRRRAALINGQFQDEYYISKLLD